MNSLEKCVRDARFVITGTGRIARLLAELLVRIGADVTVAARNADSLAYFELMGCEVKQIKEVTGWNKDFRHGYDIIFNTVPAWLFDRAFLEKSDKKLLIIELASAPGGADAGEAQKAGIRLISAQSLPGRVTPKTAGRIIYQTIREIMEEI
jgi:dipicolinate synthase subunit A